MRTYIGIDNGVSGSIGIINSAEYFYYQMPAYDTQDYTKKKKTIKRLHISQLLQLLNDKIEDPQKVTVLIERPMINPTRFNASLSAIRCLEATLAVMEMMSLGHEFVDSKSWQKELLPQGVKGPELKTASRDIGKRLFPLASDLIDKQKDADGLLIAEYARRKYNY